MTEPLERRALFCVDCEHRTDTAIFIREEPQYLECVKCGQHYWFTYAYNEIWHPDVNRFNHALHANHYQLTE